MRCGADQFNDKIAHELDLRVTSEGVEDKQVLGAHKRTGGDR